MLIPTTKNLATSPCLRTSSCTCLTGNVENKWNAIKDSFYKTAEASLKYQRSNKKKCITEKTSAIAKETVKMRVKLLDSKPEKIRERIQKDCDVDNRYFSNAYG